MGNPKACESFVQIFSAASTSPTHTASTIIVPVPIKFIFGGVTGRDESAASKI